MYKIFIDGSVGTTGLRIKQRLGEHKYVQLINIEEDKRKDIQARTEAANSADLVMLCLPDAAAKEIVPRLNKNVKICDTSTAHRTDSGWVYGFPEIGARREAIKQSYRTAVPGCHASGFIALVAPLVQKGLLPQSAKVSCYSITGYTGGGNAMIADYENKQRHVSLDAPRSYALALKHKHLPEMCNVTGLDFEPIFSPIVADFPRGMSVNVPLFLNQFADGTTAQEIYTCLNDYYSGEDGINVNAMGSAPQDGFLPANLVAGSDKMEVYVYNDGDKILLTSVFDNLGKGSSGAAIQCMNLMLGIFEREGLE